MPNTLVSLLLVPAAAAVLVVGALSGCAPATTGHAAAHPHHEPVATSPSVIATPTATPTPTGPPALPANALFRISATVTAPGGRSANLVQTVFLPAPLTATQKSQLTTGCAGQGLGTSEPVWQNNFATGKALTTTMTATLRAGSPAWNNTADGVLADFAGFGVYSGAYATFEAYCSPGFITIPGTQHAIAVIQAAKPSGQPYGWAGEFADYGFFGGGNAPGSSDPGGHAVVSNCIVQLSSIAAANPTAAAWATRVPNFAHGCEYNGAQVP